MMLALEHEIAYRHEQIRRLSFSAARDRKKPGPRASRTPGLKPVAMLRATGVLPPIYEGDDSGQGSGGAPMALTTIKLATVTREALRPGMKVIRNGCVVTISGVGKREARRGGQPVFLDGHDRPWWVYDDETIEVVQ